MDLLDAIILILTVGFLLYFVIIYNGLVQTSLQIDKAWSNIDVLLKQRHDEIPRLVEICKGYMKHEHETLAKITEARAACMQVRGVADTGRKEGILEGLLVNLFAVVENYPDLKANESFLRLQHRTSDLENQIADRREFYNDSVTTYNTRIDQIPDLFVARLLIMNKRAFFRTTVVDRQNVKMAFTVPS